MTQFIKKLDSVGVILNRCLIAVAGFFLVAMMVLTVANVFLRSFGMSLKGTFELMGYCGAIAAALALAKTQVARQHIAVDVLIRIFPRTLQIILSVIGSLIGVIFFVLAALQTWRMGNNFWQVNELSETLRIAYFPFVYAVSLGLAVIALVLAIQMLQVLKGEKKL